MLLLAVVVGSMLAGCGAPASPRTSPSGGQSAVAPAVSASAPASVSPTAVPTLDADIGDARLAGRYTSLHGPRPEMDAVFASFVAYWKAYLTAVNTNDAAPYASVSSGEALEKMQDSIKQMRSVGWRLQIQVLAQRPPVIDMPDTSAAVIDDVTNTRQEVVDSKDRILSDKQFTTPFLREVHLQDGVWKVTRVWSVQAPVPSASPTPNLSQSEPAPQPDGSQKG